MGRRIVKENNIFGDVVSNEKPIREKYLEPPFSVLDTKSANWQKRRKLWLNLGIRSEVGRDAKLFGATQAFASEKYGRDNKKAMAAESIFDPALCEVLYNWYCPENGTIIDPFAGGSVRGIVANYLGYKYTGIDIRPEQIESNIEQGVKILGQDNMPNWITGDSMIELDKLKGNEYDFLFSCPPYADLEVYSDLEGDISNKKYPEFLKLYREIIFKSCMLLKDGGFACFVTGEVRNKKTGELYNFINDTVQAFRDAGLIYYNDAILLNHIGTAMLRAGNIFDRGNGKLVKIHQYVQIFKKPVIDFSL